MQADLNLRWVHMSEGVFSDIRAYMVWGLHGKELLVSKYLTHLCLVESSTSSLWTGPIPIEVGLVSFYYYHVL